MYNRSSFSTTTSRPRWLGLVVALTLLGTLLVSAQGAAASCAGPFRDLAVEIGGPLFLGTPTQQVGNAFEVDVTEIWRGPDLSRRVWVQFEGPNSEVLQMDEPFVIATYDDGSFRTNDCLVAASTQSLRGELASDGVREPIDEGAVGVPPGLIDRLPFAVAIMLTVLLLVMILAWHWRRRHRILKNGVGLIRRTTT